MSHRQKSTADWRPSARLEVAGLPARIIDLPIWLAALMPALMTMGALYTLGIVPEGRVINPLLQYKGVFPGDVSLAVGMGVAFCAAIWNFPKSWIVRWFETVWWRIIALVTALVLGVLFTGREIWAMVSDPHGPATYTVRQFFSPTHLVHTVIVPWMIYLTLIIVIPTLFHARGSRWLWLQKSIVLVGYIGWGWGAIYYDNTHPRPNLANIHPLDGGWFGGWWPHIWRLIWHFL